MIRGHVALVRQLRSFMEMSGLPWTAVRFRYDHDEDGRPYLDNNRIEISFQYRGHQCDVVILSPTEEPIEGVEHMPLGRIAGRCGTRVVKGPIDQSTWDDIVRMINEEVYVC